MKDNDLGPIVRPLDQLDDGELNHNQPSETVNIKPPVAVPRIELDDKEEPDFAGDHHRLAPKRLA